MREAVHWVDIYLCVDEHDIYAPGAASASGWRADMAEIEKRVGGHGRVRFTEEGQRIGGQLLGAEEQRKAEEGM